MDEAVRAFLVPTPAGALFSASNPQPHAKRAVIRGLLQGAASEPLPLDKLVSWTGLPDSKAVRGLLFEMQREGLLNADPAPFVFPGGSLEQILPVLLGDLSNTGMSLLSDASGLCIAFAGFAQPVAERLAAFVVDCYRPYRGRIDDLEGALVARPFAWAVVDPKGDTSLVATHLCIGDHLFYLVLGGPLSLDSWAVVHLIALLNRYFMGESKAR